MCLLENHSLLLPCQNPGVRTVVWTGMQSEDHMVVRAAISNYGEPKGWGRASLPATGLLRAGGSSCWLAIPSAAARDSKPCIHSLCLQPQVSVSPRPPVKTVSNCGDFEVSCFLAKPRSSNKTDTFLLPSSEKK